MVVVKHNHLVSASYKLKLDAKRLLLTCIARLDSKTTKTTKKDGFRVTALEFAKLFGLDQKNSYGQLKDAADNLFESKILIRSKNTDRYIRARWVSDIEYSEGEGCVDVCFTNRILPYLTQLSGNFTQYNLEYISKMTSSHAIRLYEILKKQQGLDRSEFGSFKISIEEFKEMMGCGDLYPQTKHFMDRVTKIAVMQINKHSELTVRTETARDPRTKIMKDLKFVYSNKQESHKRKSNFAVSKKMKELGKAIKSESVEKIKNKPIDKTRKPTFTLN